MSNELVVSPLEAITHKLAERFDLGDGGKDLLDTLRLTAFRQRANDAPVSNAQMLALLVVANQYGLNPWTKEIYAFPDKGSIIPVVGVDGWSRVINSHPAFDGMSFEQDEESCTCTIYRKDRSHPISITEFLVECKKDTGPWKTHPRRMLRHKAMIQCARIAMGFVGIYDPDEADRIREAREAEKEIDPATGEIMPGPGKPAVSMPKRKVAPAKKEQVQDAPYTVDMEAPAGEPDNAAVEPVEPEQKKPATNNPQAEPAGNGALASEGERNWILAKLKRKDMSVADAREAAGLSPAETLDGLTKDGWASLKDVVMA